MIVIFIIKIYFNCKKLKRSKAGAILMEIKKGRNPLELPSARDVYILNALKKGCSQAEVGRFYGLTRQCVHQIKNRWPKLVK